MNIAVDLGGTNVRVGLVEGNRIVRLLSQPCHAKGPEEEVTGQIFSMIEELLPGSPVKGIGVGVPSVVDMDKGIVYDVIGIPSWKEVHLKELLEARFSLPAYINNDCNCFALGFKVMLFNLRLHSDLFDLHDSLILLSFPGFLLHFIAVSAEIKDLAYRGISIW